MEKSNPFLSHRPYVYAVVWSEHNVAYVGVRHAKGCHPSDLWTRYFTSSKYVAEFRKKHGEPDRVEIIDMFLTAAEAVAAETDIITTFELHRNPLFLNKQCSGQIIMDEDVRSRIKETWTDERRARKRSQMLGQKRTPETLAKISATRTGQKNSEESNMKRSATLTGRPSKLVGRTAHNKGKPSPLKGKSRDPEIGRKISEAKKRANAARRLEKEVS